MAEEFNSEARPVTPSSGRVDSIHSLGQSIERVGVAYPMLETELHRAHKRGSIDCSARCTGDGTDYHFVGGHFAIAIVFGARPGVTGFD